MTEVVIKTRENGPLLVTGPVILKDHQGNTFDLTGMENVALCRCGHSQRKPFCDGAHRATNFAACETAIKHGGA